MNNLENISAGENKVSFKSKGINLVGNLYLPSDFDPNQTYEGIVMTPPFPQVKNQVRCRLSNSRKSPTCFQKHGDR